MLVIEWLVEFKEFDFEFDVVVVDCFNMFENSSFQVL